MLEDGPVDIDDVPDECVLDDVLSNELMPASRIPN